MQKIVFAVYILDEYFTDDFIGFAKRFFDQHGLEKLFYTLRVKNGDASVKEDFRTGELKFYTIGVTKLDPSKLGGKNAARTSSKNSKKKYSKTPNNVDDNKDDNKDDDNKNDNNDEDSGDDNGDNEDNDDKKK